MLRQIATFNYTKFTNYRRTASICSLPHPNHFNNFAKLYHNITYLPYRPAAAICQCLGKLENYQKTSANNLQKKKIQHFKPFVSHYTLDFIIYFLMSWCRTLLAKAIRPGWYRSFMQEDNNCCMSLHHFLWMCAVQVMFLCCINMSPPRLAIYTFMHMSFWACLQQQMVQTGALWHTVPAQQDSDSLIWYYNQGWKKYRNLGT